MLSVTDLTRQLEAQCAALDIPFDPGWAPPITAHLGLLERWAPRINLTTVWKAPEALARHAVDSLALLRLEPVRRARGAAIDVGSGAGFPGIPLAVALPNVPWTLLEPRHKRAVFLRRVVADAGIRNVEVVEGRVPDASLNGRFSLAVSRATLAPEEWLAAAEALLDSAGCAAVMAAGRPALESLDRWHLLAETHLSIGDANRYVAAFGRHDV